MIHVAFKTEVCDPSKDVLFGLQMTKNHLHKTISNTLVIDDSVEVLKISLGLFIFKLSLIITSENI